MKESISQLERSCTARNATAVRLTAYDLQSLNMMQSETKFRSFELTRFK